MRVSHTIVGQAVRNLPDRIRKTTLKNVENLSLAIAD